MVIPGSEKIYKISPIMATGQRRIDFAIQFLKEYNFAGALTVLPDIDEKSPGIWPETLAATIRMIRQSAAFYAAWDRLDYKGANNLGQKIKSTSDGEWQDIAPTTELRDWVGELSDPWPDRNHRDYFSLRALQTRRIAIDLLANGLRRIHHQQYEDAFIRAYRVLELIGQIWLFEKGFDSANLPDDDDRIKGFIEECRKKGKSSSLECRGGKITAARETAAILLKYLGDPRGKELLQLAGDKYLRITKRNVSILIHGYRAEAPSDKKMLKEIYDKLEAILVKDSPETVTRLNTLNRIFRN